MKNAFYVSTFRPNGFGVFTETELIDVKNNLEDARSSIPLGYQRIPFNEMGRNVEHIMISNLEKLKNESDILEYYQKK